MTLSRLFPGARKPAAGNRIAPAHPRLQRECPQTRPSSLAPHPSSFLLHPSSFSPRLSSRSGMTMVELVAALALGVIIIGSLLTVLDSATNLWSSSRSQQREQIVADTLSGIIAADLWEAVTDNGTPTNSAVAKPTFYLDTPASNAAPGEVKIILGFVRTASPRTLATGLDGSRRLSLDAVFYTVYDNALFRHVLPLAYTASFAEPEPLGELLNVARQTVDNSASLHSDLLAANRDPSHGVSAEWTCSLLAERLELGLTATLPAPYADGAPGSENTTVTALKAYVLPDSIDLAFCLYSEEDWSAYQQLRNDSSDAALRKKRLLGLLGSKKFTFPTKGGSRL